MGGEVPPAVIEIVPNPTFPEDLLVNVHFIYLVDERGESVYWTFEEDRVVIVLNVVKVVPLADSEIVKVPAENELPFK